METVGEWTPLGSSCLPGVRMCAQQRKHLIFVPLYELPCKSFIQGHELASCHLSEVAGAPRADGNDSRDGFTLLNLLFWNNFRFPEKWPRRQSIPGDLSLSSPRC